MKINEKHACGEQLMASAEQYFRGFISNPESSSAGSRYLVSELAMICLHSHVRGAQLKPHKLTASSDSQRSQLF